MTIEELRKELEGLPDEGLVQFLDSHEEDYSDIESVEFHNGILYLKENDD